MPEPTNGEILRQIGALEARLAEYDRRMDELNQETDKATRANAKAIADTAAALGAIDRAVAVLRKPFWKRPTFLGGFCAVLIFVGLWIASGFTRNSPIAQYIHQNILLTDNAIASTLETSRIGANGRYISPALAAIGDVVADQVENGTATHSKIANMARRLGRQTYNDAKTFFPTQLTSIGLGCLLANDQGYVAAIGADPIRMQALCARDMAQQVTISLPYVDTSALRIPFNAKKGDTVTLTIDVVATSQSDPDELRRNPTDAVNVFLDANSEPSTKIAAADSRATVRDAIEGEDNQHFYTIALSDLGLDMVGLAATDSEMTGVPKLYAVSVSATVKVEPME